jgi:hypothetical protein
MKTEPDSFSYHIRDREALGLALGIWSGFMIPLLQDTEDHI